MAFRGFRNTLVAALCGTMLLGSSPAFAQAPDPKVALANGDKAAKAKDWATAAREFDTSYKSSPSPEALEGLANAEYQQKHDAAAYAAYDEWNKKYGPSNAAKKKTVEARLKEIEGRTGLLAIDVAEPGGAIRVDDRPMGTTPSPPLRLGLGPHRVRITKDGFVPIDQTPNVTTGVTSTLSGKLEASTTKSRITVKEKTGKPIRVMIDGVDMGDAPWSGEVEAGSHDVGARAGAFTAVTEKVTLEPGKPRDVELVASSTSAPLKVNTSDGKGLIYLDGKLVGEGTFVGDVPAGPHQLKVTREGYDPFEEQLELKDKEALARSITMKLSSKIETNEVTKEGRRLEGIYGGFGLMLAWLPTTMGHTPHSLCNATDRPAELSGCDGAGSDIGGGLTGFIGYHWDPVGVELYAGGQYDSSSPTLTWGASSTDPGFGPDPARTEEFHIHRFGGFVALRIRYTLQTEKIRFSVAGGIGISLRKMLLTRDATAASDPALKDTFVPDSVGYSSPMLSLEPSIQYRIKPGVAVSLGFSLLVENPNVFSGNPTTPADGSHHLFSGVTGQPAPGITTPSYTLASGTQLYVGPVIGMMFGP